ncbi:TPA: sugar kinase [Streptococcus agalactiae]
MSKILFFGEPLIRITPKENDYFADSISTKLFYGGSEVNTARALQGFGQDTKLLSALPNNPIGNSFLQFLKAQGIDTHSIQWVGERVGLYFLEDSFACRKGEVVYDRDHSSLHDFRINQIDFDQLFEGVSLFHFSGITLSLDESIQEITLLLLKEAKKREITISLDLNFRSKLISPKNAKILFSQFATFADICFGIEPLMVDSQDTTFFNRDEATIEDIKERMISLINHFDFQVIFHTKRLQDEWGRNHYQAYIANRKQEFVTSKEITTAVNQRIGSGDAFVAGALYQLLQHSDSKTVIDFAVASASLKCALEGDNMFETVTAVNKVLNQSKDIIR